MLGLQRSADSATAVDVIGRKGLLPDSPVLPAAIAGIVATVFVFARLVDAARGDISRFIMAAPPFATARLVPHGISVGRSGYDGQFFYRLALDPLNLHRLAFGIRLDNSLRLQRIGYPVLAWLASAGHHSLVPVSLVAVNVAAITGMAWFGGVIAQDGGRHALWGLALAGYFGYVVTLGRDLSEIVAAFFIVAGLVAIRREHPFFAAGALSAAALTKETTLVVAAAYGLVRVIEMARRRAGPGRADVAWVLPCIVFFGWQVVVRIMTGSVPLLSDRQQNVGLPLVALYHGLRQNLAAFPGHTALIWLGELGILALIVGAATHSVKTSKTLTYERIAWVLAVGVALSLSTQVWGRSFDEFRTLGELYVLSWVILFSSRKSVRAPTVLTAGSWLVIAAHHVATL